MIDMISNGILVVVAVAMHCALQIMMSMRLAMVV
jgi:hypothetical protein